MMGFLRFGDTLVPVGLSTPSRHLDLIFCCCSKNVLPLDENHHEYLNHLFVRRCLDFSNIRQEKAHLSYHQQKTIRSFGAPHFI